MERNNELLEQAISENCSVSGKRIAAGTPSPADAAFPELQQLIT